MICHAHVTFKPGVSPSSALLDGRGWKPTEIIVWNEQREDHDLMLTKYFVVGTPVYPTLQAVIDEIGKLEGVMRVKIERTRTWQPVDREHYAEFHVKVEDGAPFPTALGWARSRNPRDRVDGKLRYFYNKRVYSGVMEEIIEQVKQELDGVPYVELKVEQNIYDSNRVHDSWWA